MNLAKKVLASLRKALLFVSCILALVSFAAWGVSYRWPYYSFRPIPHDPDWLYIQRAKLRTGQLEVTLQSARLPRTDDLMLQPVGETTAHFDARGSSRPLGLGITRKRPTVYSGISLGKPFSICIQETRIALPILPLTLLFCIWPGLWLIRHPGRKKKARMRRGLCVKCGYNLVGNTTGICPECGT